MTQKAKEAAGMYSIGTIDLYQFLDCCTSIEEAKEAMDAFEMEVLPMTVELKRACWRNYEINHAWTLYDRDALRNLRELRLKRIADENPKYPSYEEWIMALEQLHKTYTDEELQLAFRTAAIVKDTKLNLRAIDMANSGATLEEVYEFFSEQGYTEENQARFLRAFLSKKEPVNRHYEGIANMYFDNELPF